LMHGAEGFVRRNLTILLVIMALLVFAMLTLPAFTPKPVPNPIEGYYDYQPGVGVTSTYRITYRIPNPVNVTQPQTLTVSFNASSLVGQTNSVEVNWLNVTIVASDNKVLFTHIVNEAKKLKQGGVWGPKDILFTIDNSTVRLGPGSETTAKVLISISFDEILEVPFAGAQHYRKLGQASPKDIVIRSPYGSPRPVFQFDLYHALVTAAFVGGATYAAGGILGVVLGLPRRDTRLPSGFRDPATGRAVATLAAYRAIFSVLIGFGFVAMAQVGLISEHQINLMKMITDFFMGRQDVEVLAAGFLWMGGALLGQFRR